MKRIVAILLCAAMLLSLAACGKKGKEDAGEQTESAASKSPVVKVDISLSNLYQYFEYKEFPSIVREDNDKISSVQVSYGLALREGYEAANLPEYEDTLELTFTADGVIKSGSFVVDFDTLQYSGEEYSVQRETVSETLAFWPEGNRTFIWTFGNYSKSNILYLENFQVTRATGCIYLKNT
ncbi:MAG: hypothetical protein IJ594_05455 [Oscillospiraceae bacterium]|nr:hypothetical protein [Oscillospiraceae bacterium]